MTRRIKLFRAFTLIELLVTISIIALLLALIVSGVNRSKERAKRAKCDALLRQFYLMVRMYADDNDGFVAGYTNFSRRMEMVCPSDKKVIRTGVYSSFEDSTYVFGSRQRLDDADEGTWMLVEDAPFHDLSKKRSPDSARWIGRFNILNADGTIRWTVLEQ